MDNYNLYRGKDLNTGEWVEGYLLHVEGHDETFIVDKFIQKEDSIVANDFKMIDPDTATMFTNRYDKNGKPIFEGDIVESSSWNEYFTINGNVMKPFVRRFVIEWKEFEFKLVEHYKDEVMKPSEFEVGSANDVIIIGNIYDNPDIICKSILGLA